MTAHAWLTLVACIGQLGLAVLVIVRGSKSPLALPLALVCLNFFSWNMAWLAYLVTGQVGWRYLDVAISPLILPLALHFVVVFVGKRRQLRHVIWIAYAVMGAIGLTALAAFVSPGARAFAGSPTWAVLFLIGAVLGVGFALRLLVTHLRRATDAEEQMRTRLVLAAWGLGWLLAFTELIADLGVPIPRGGALGALASAGVLSIVVFRFRLLESELSSRAGVYALSIGALAVVAYLAVVYFFAAHTAMLVLGTITVTSALLVGLRQVTAAVARHRQRMEALVVLGRFSAQMAHDMKNPLSALKGAVQYLREERARGRSVAEFDEFLQLLAEQIDRMGAVIDKYQRLGRVEPALETVRLNDLVRRVVALQEFASERQVRTELELAQNLPSVQADPDLIAGALDNLLRNAVEAMPNGGVLTLRTELSSAGSGAERVAVSVGDTGHGMDARAQELAFDDFYTTKATGSGLGLPFVRRVAHAHGGEVRITSTLGQGTVACVELPLRSGLAA